MKISDLLNELTPEEMERKKKLLKRAKTILKFYGNGEFTQEYGDVEIIIKYRVTRIPAYKVDLINNSVTFYFPRNVKFRELEFIVTEPSDVLAFDSEDNPDQYLYDHYLQFITDHIGDMTDRYKVHII